jgi:serine/threonine protein kinase
MHKSGFFHRDLKPENLLLSDGADPGSTILKIADFGFSARFAMAADEKTNMDEW